MDIETFRNYCLAKPGTSEDFPFDEVTLVLRVMGKIFAFLPLDTSPPQAALKCDPDRSVELRERFAEIRPGFHLNKKHWNELDLESSLDDALIRELIDHSYDLVVKGLKKAERETLLGLGTMKT